MQQILWVCAASATLSTVLAFCSVLANTILLIVIYKDPLRCFRKPIGVFVTVLALLDFITGAAVSIHFIKVEISCALHRPTTPPKYGQLATIVSFFALNARNYTLLALSIERLLAVACPFYYRRSASLKKTVACTVAITCYSFLFSLLQLADVPESIYIPIELHLNISFPLAVVIIANIVTWHLLKQHRLRTSSMTSEASEGAPTRDIGGRAGYERETREFAFTAIVIAVFFAISLIPFYVMFQVEGYCSGCKAAWWFIVCKKISLPLLFVSSAANPFIYIMRLSQCRRSCRIALCCLVSRGKDFDVELKRDTSARSYEVNPSAGSSKAASRETGQNNDGLSLDTEL